MCSLSRLPGGMKVTGSQKSSPNFDKKRRFLEPLNRPEVSAAVCRGGAGAAARPRKGAGGRPENPRASRGVEMSHESREKCYIISYST